VPGAANPQAYNRYSYVLNNPLRYTDPSGHKWVCIGANGDHCYDDGVGPVSGMVHTPVKPPSGSNNNNGGSNGGTPTTTSTPGPVFNPGPTTTPTASSTPGPFLEPGSTSSGICGTNMYCLSTATSTFVPLPIDPIKTAVSGGIEILDITKPSYEPFDAVKFWNTIGNSLPVLGQHFPATSVDQVVTKVVNVAISVAEAGTNVITNTALAISEAVYTGVGGLTPFIFSVPSSNPFSPSLGST